MQRPGGKAGFRKRERRDTGTLMLDMHYDYSSLRPTDDHGARPFVLVIFQEDLAATQFLRVAVPVDREDRKPPQRPSYVVEQQVADPEDQRRPDDGVRNSQAHQHILHLGLASEIGEA